MQTANPVAAAQQPTVPAASTPLPPVTQPAMPADPSAATPAANTAAHATAASAGHAGGGAMGGTGGGMPAAAPPVNPPPPAMPLAPPATPSPAAPTAPGGGPSATPATATGAGSPGVHAASTGKTDATVGAAPVPVSAARLERDAIASAASGGAGRKGTTGNTALILARRIAAALNIGVSDFGFYWVTGLTTDGAIVVANSYGLGYIPDGVRLPPQVAMATADETVTPADRATWATYPILAIQGWTRAHGHTLRAVIATEEQFASFDPGAAKIVLRTDDIPTTGAMDGRTRLEVISPQAAARLAAVPDAALTDLLPPAPADTNAPVDKSNALWFELIKPLMATSPERAGVHLRAFVAYAEHAQELALHRAHVAADAAAQRAAIADWVYWQHLAVLMWEATEANAAV